MLGENPQYLFFRLRLISLLRSEADVATKVVNGVQNRGYVGRLHIKSPLKEPDAVRTQPRGTTGFQSVENRDGLEARRTKDVRTAG